MSEESLKLRLQPRLTLEPPPPPEAVAADSPADDSGLNFPALPLPLEAPAFPDLADPPMAATDGAEPAPAIMADPPQKSKMTLRRRIVEPTAALSPLEPPLLLPAKAGFEPAQPAKPEMIAAGRRVQRVALGLGAAGVLMFVVASYVAYQNLSVEAKALPAQPREPWSFRRQRPDSAQTRSGTPAKFTEAEPNGEIAEVTTPAESVQVSELPATGPSAAFQAWVGNLKINGVRPGDNPRILVARKLYSTGEVINPELGITFESYDAARRMVRFRDKAGFFLEHEAR